MEKYAIVDDLDTLLGDVDDDYAIDLDDGEPDMELVGKFLDGDIKVSGEDNNEILNDKIVEKEKGNE